MNLKSKHQTFALIFGKDIFYLIDLQYHHIGSYDKAYVQSYLNQTDFTKLPICHSSQWNWHATMVAVVAFT